jgi:hypothetical protein
MNTQLNRYNFSNLPDKLLGFPNSHISECYVGKDFNSVNIGDIVEYDGTPSWNRWQEIEIEERLIKLNCDYITWFEGDNIVMRFVIKK